jgi:hypothetical protein
VSCWSCAFVLGLSLALAASKARASDGVIEINQAAALTGGATPGDALGFPVTISEEGSYQLTGSLTVSDPSVSAIVIQASSVTLDLNGFTIRGSWVVGTGCSVLGTGAGIISQQEGVVVRRGRVVGMSQSGVSLAGPHSRVEATAVARSCRNGIEVGELGQVIDSQAIESHVGIATGSASRVSGSQALRNRNTGIFVGNDSIVTQSVAASNAFLGIAAGAGSLVIANSASLNGGSGIHGGDGVLALQNSANANGALPTPIGFGFGYSDPAASGVGLSVFNGNRDGAASNGVAIGCSSINGVAVCPP